MRTGHHRSAKTSVARREAGEVGCRKRKAAGGENGDPNKKVVSRAQQQAAGQAGGKAGDVELKRKAGQAGGVEQKRKANQAGGVEQKRKAGEAGGRAGGVSRSARRGELEGEHPGRHVLQSQVGAVATATRTSCSVDVKRRSRASLTSSTESPAWWANL
jgi:hypothetical protein